MKKILTYVLIITLLGGIFGIVLSNTNIEEQAPVVGAILEMTVLPAIAYADSGIGDGPGVPPPAIPQDP